MKSIFFVILSISQILNCEVSKINTKKIDINNFGFAIFNELSYCSNNIFISPFSISMAFSLAYLGSANNTEKQIQNVFHFEKNTYSFHKNYGIFLDEVNSLRKNKNISINIANSTWFNKNEIFKDDYLLSLEKYYKSEVKIVDYNDVVNAIQQINKWTSVNTKTKIPNILQPGDIDSATLLVIVNAIYFKGIWQHKFDQKVTSKEDFYINQNTPIKCDMMKIKNIFQYTDNASFEIIRIPYIGNTISMIIILPKNKSDDLYDGIKLSSDIFHVWLNSLLPTEIILKLPKFKIKFKKEIKPSLLKLGVHDAFNQTADFKKITDSNIYISKIIHDAFIEVNEEGTEAAAATALVMRKCINNEIKTFNVNRPFIFMIIENKYNQLLFIGKIGNPN